MPASEERLWAMGAHLSPLVGLTVIAPLVVYLVQKDRSALVRHHAAEALNFQITLLIGVVVAILLAIVLIGFVLILGLVVWGLLMPILAAVAASSGKPYRYPLTIPFVS